jgi:hypothetical protein
MVEPLCMSVLAKIHEQIERTDHLIGLLTPENLDWGPSPLGLNCWPKAKLLGHPMECLAGFCAVLFAANPEQLPHFSRLRDMRVNHWCEASEARDGGAAVTSTSWFTVPTGRLRSTRTTLFTSTATLDCNTF